MVVEVLGSLPTASGTVDASICRNRIGPVRRLGGCPHYAARLRLELTQCDCSFAASAQ